MVVGWLVRNEFAAFSQFLMTEHCPHTLEISAESGCAILWHEDQGKRHWQVNLEHPGWVQTSKTFSPEISTQHLSKVKTHFSAVGAAEWLQWEPSTFREVACQMKVFSSWMGTIVWAVSTGSLWRIDSYPLPYPNLINLSKPIHWYSVNIPISSLVRILLSLFPLISAAHSILTTSDLFFSLFC